MFLLLSNYQTLLSEWSKYKSKYKFRGRRMQYNQCSL